MGTHSTYITKRELAMAYAPGMSYSAAQRRFERWVNGNPRLLKALKKENYKIFSKKLTPKQLRVIFKYLGEP